MLSDYLRTLAIHRYSSEARACWLVDLDTIWLRSVSENAQIEVAANRGKGHVFSSMRASDRFFGTAEAKASFFKKNFLRKPSDKLYLATPFRLPCASQMVRSYINRFEQQVLLPRRSKKQIQDYNYSMSLFRTLLHEHQLVSGILLPNVMSPLDYNLKVRVLTTHKKEWESNLKRSVAVNNFWQSSRGPVCQDINMMAEDSTLHKVLSKAFVA